MDKYHKQNNQKETEKIGKLRTRRKKTDFKDLIKDI